MGWVWVWGWGWRWGRAAAVATRTSPIACVVAACRVRRVARPFDAQLRARDHTSRVVALGVVASVGVWVARQRLGRFFDGQLDHDGGRVVDATILGHLVRGSGLGAQVRASVQVRKG